MKLYNVEHSGNCYKVRLFLSLLGIEYETETIDIKNREQKSPEFLTINPLGEIPVLVDGDLVLRDSQAILVYLAKKYGDENWFPTKADEMAQAMQWLSTACNEIARGPMDSRIYFKLKANIDIEKAHEKSNTILTVINHHLENNEWLALNRITIADIACFPYIALANDGKISLEPFGNINDWILRIKQQPNFISMPGIK